MEDFEEIIMNRLYSRSTGCSYFADVHDKIPADAVPITEDLYFQVIASPSLGKIRTHDDDGLPYLIDEPRDLPAEERAWRDGQVSTTEWLVTRHRDELDMQQATTLTAEQFTALLTYRQALRDWPQSEAFPDTQQRPIAPAWIAEQNR